MGHCGGFPFNRVVVESGGKGMDLTKLRVREHKLLVKDYPKRFYVSDGDSHYIHPNLEVVEGRLSFLESRSDREMGYALYTEEEAREVLAEFIERQTD